jgi:large repetitive protein
LAGITVELYKSPQIPGVDVPLATTVTSPVGLYGFADLKPGDYVVYLPVAPDYPPGVTTPQDANDDSIDNDNNGSQVVFGGAVSSPLIHLGAGENDPTIDIGFTCYGTWQEWQVLNPLGGQNQPGDNPDGDAYVNLVEYAFRLPANSGEGAAFSIKPSSVSTSKVEIDFERPLGATANVTYYLEYSRALGDAVSWINLPLSTILPRNLIVTPTSPCTESVTILNFEAHEGFVRLRAELDSNGDHAPDHIARTGTQGWTESAVGVGTRTYNNPYPHGAVFTGTVDASGGVSGQTLHMSTSAGATDLGTLLAPAAAYYLEVTAGANAGQRFDVVSAAGSTVTLAADTDLLAGTPPFNTLAGAAPASLAGNPVAIHRHWTLGEMFPTGRFLAAADPTAADEVQTFAKGAWTSYWLDANGGTPKWVRDGDATLADQAATVLAPGQGMMVVKHTNGTPLLVYGEVRENPFVRPLGGGMNLVGGGYPVAQSATGPGSRRMDLAHGFAGSLDPASADTFSLWKGDATPGASGYDIFYLYNPGTAPKWVLSGDATLSPRDTEKLFLSDRSVFIGKQTDLLAYTMPSPWAPGPFIAQQQAGGASTWAQWQAEQLAGVALNGPADDPDGDGTPNLLEFVFGTPPLQAGPPPATPPNIVTLAGQRYLQITIARRSEHPATLSVEVSSDLTTWNAGPGVTTVVSDTPAALVVRDLTPLDAATPHRFMRLRATVPAP